MADEKQLKTFEVRAVAGGDEATLHIADEGGGELVLRATREQLDVIADAIDDLLDTTEAADEV
ncbi:hypothetical protein [Aureimonas leprariae]|uniref:Uncharacterized protein n=1 Tax=Plantimonas leprariae TaxID=2615207 RepID=A0A7V7PLL3_9HYPH|nr:hypothetical protein [Aureimonas leprariae]KAB0677178.1 hypothetical protein F6X38_18810 [Aureimonas leprariae]